jgi:osmotically-inducible protein OsmY
VAVVGILAGTGLAQQGVVERAGQKLDEVGRGIRRGAVEVSEAVRKRFDVVRTDVQRMGTSSRVYSRIHWDRALHDSKIEVHVLRDGSVLLRGMVPDAQAKQRAIALAKDTVDVSAVVDELGTYTPTEEVKAARPR